MSKNTAFKALLAVQTLGLLAYTFIAFQHEGAGLFGIFFNNITSLNWSGQFNLDFLCYLTLSGIWIMWRNRFSPASVLIGVLAMIIGMMFFAPYVLWLIQRENGDLKRVLLGER